MSKVADYLQEHLVGEVMTSADARQYFATDASIYTIMPAIVVYPRNENDVRKTARFTWQLAERGRIIPITARGSGTDLTGAAVGAGIVMAFPAHQHRILELDGKSGDVTVEPGINYGKLQQTLLTHGRFLPAYPASMEYSTIGGALANNAGGERSFKYGTTRDMVKRLRVVLANGEVIETRRLSKRELSKKLGLGTMEGEVYRQLDALIEEHHGLIKELSKDVTKNNAGYALSDVKRKDGSFDLTPLIIGSQGTLGLVTEAVLATEVYTPQTTLIMAQIQDLAVAQEIITKLRAYSDKPCSIEMVDSTALKIADAASPALLKGIIDTEQPGVTLFVEFDDTNDRTQKRMAKKATKLFEQHGVTARIESDPDTKDELTKVRAVSATVLAQSNGQAKPLPVIDDAVVPVGSIAEFMKAAYALFEEQKISVALWGHVGDGNIHAQPMFNIAEIGDRQKIFKLVEQYYDLVLSVGGVTTGEHGDGRLRGAFLPRVYGAEAYDLLVKTKAIFDPYATLNPGVKIGVTLDTAKQSLRTQYDLGGLYDHMPRS